MWHVFSLISKLTANQRLLLHHVILVLRNISAHESVTRMTAANLAVCVAPALLWRARCASRLPEIGDEHLMHDVGRLSLVVQRIIDAEDSALFGDELDYLTPFGDLSVTSLEPSSLDDSDASIGYKRCNFFLSFPLSSSSSSSSSWSLAAVVNRVRSLGVFVVLCGFTFTIGRQSECLCHCSFCTRFAIIAVRLQTGFEIVC